MLIDFDDQFDVPHARCGDLSIEAVEAEEDLLILIKSVEAKVGFHVAVSKDLRTVLMQGHGEYDRLDLHHEYLRDKGDEDDPQNTGKLLS